MTAQRTKKEPIFTRDFLLIFLAGGLIRVCYQMQNTIVPLYGDHLGFSATAVGLTTTVCTIASLILRPFLGDMLDRYGRRIIVLVGTALFAVATLLCGFAGGIAVLMALRALQGFGFSAHTTAVNTMATDVLPESRMTEGIGYMGLTGSVSMAIAPTIALLFVDRKLYLGGFTAAFAAGALAIACLLGVRSNDTKSKAAGTKTTVRGWQRFWEKGAIRPALIMLVLGACYAGLSTFLATWGLGRGFTAAEMGSYFTVNAAAMMVARLLGGRVADKIGMKRAMLGAAVLCCIGFLLLPTAGSVVILCIAAAIHGIGYGTIYPMLNAIAITGSPADRRGTAMATFLTGMDIGVGFGAGLWGVAIDLFGMNAMLYVCAGIMAIVYMAYRLLIAGAKQHTQR